MREIEAAVITETVARLAVEATHFLPEDVEGAIRDARETERSPLGVQIIDEILENAEIARERMLPLWQDTGTAVVHVELGQDVHVTGGFLLDAINDGIEQGYGEGYLRKSIVAHPFGDRKNTGTNTPGVIHTEIVPGDEIHIGFMPKGGGCENMSRYQNFLPGAGREAVIDFVCETVDLSGENPCPPLIIGVGVGGTGALLNRHIKSVEVVAFEDLGTEAIRRLEVNRFPAIVVNDAHGGDLLEAGRAEYRTSTRPVPVVGRAGSGGGA